MTALLISASAVAYVSGPVDVDQVAGEAFDAGDLLHKSGTDGKWYLAECDNDDAHAGQYGLGLALATADAAGGRVTVARGGSIVTVGAGTAGTVYHPGTTAGDLIPSADLSADDRASIAALGLSTNRLLIVDVFHADADVPGA